LTVLENVRLAAQATGTVNFRFWQHKQHYDEFITRAEAVLKTVDLASDTHKLANALPHGGKRKLELAILLAANPKLLLLDEPTAGMASEQVPELMAVIDNIRRDGQRTIVLVEHNMNVVMNISNKITVMNYGEVLAEGTPDEIASNETVQSVYLGGLYKDFGR
jgi:branched-chain amino acid transport system ATP-binding protein